MAAERRFRAMGSDAHVIVVGGDDRLIERVAQRIDDLEARWSRFLPGSEVSALNREAGRPVAVSAETTLLVERAVAAWRLSAGAFDPTVLGAVLRAGYDRSFDRIGPRRDGSGWTGLSLGAGADAIVVEGNLVRIPEGSGFDPGGMGKGLAADMVTAEAMEAGAEGVSVNLGGDLRVRGCGPEGGSWTVAIEHPWVDRPIALVGLADGAVATSTTLLRRWSVDGTPRHHLIDPQTGLPSDTDVALASVVAADGWVAEVLAKACLLAGWDHAFDIIGGTGGQALVVDHQGRVKATEGLADFLGGAGVRDLYWSGGSRKL
jgi:thiamine biosynthesis lipoprotein